MEWSSNYKSFRGTQYYRHNPYTNSGHLLLISEQSTESGSRPFGIGIGGSEST
jgi:hypothetical protein